ncbi:hypothetical protein VTO73DRAFT_8026 [Trametes versicolor]
MSESQVRTPGQADHCGGDRLTADRKMYGDTVVGTHQFKFTVARVMPVMVASARPQHSLGCDWHNEVPDTSASHSPPVWFTPRGSAVLLASSALRSARAAK